VQCETSIVGGKTPGDGGARGIALGFQSGNALTQSVETFDAPGQTASCKNADFDLGHIEPTAMFGGVMELNPLQDAACFGRLESFIEGSRRVSVEVVLHDANVFHIRIDLIDEPADAVGVVNLGTMLGHFHMTPTRERLDEEKEIGRPQPLIFVIDAFWLSRLHQLWRTHVGFWSDEFFIEANGGVEGIVLFFIQVQNIYNGPKNLNTERG